jgi:hypothetical protein
MEESRMKHPIICEEEYIYELDDLGRGRTEIELTDEEVERYHRVMADFREMQHMLWERSERAKGHI